ncbi:MAG: AAA family ATPase [Eubacterium sp.]|nr:AAA family ATPase [Eubacterium sp.]
MIGREREKDILNRCLETGRPEFLVVYGRRRVGKTYLVKEYFKNRFAFYATGLAKKKTREQLTAFHRSLQEYGATETTIPKDWFEAFSRLRKLLESSDARTDSASGKKVVFLDELPWMDTARSDFRSAFEFFWNTWGSSRKELLLIVCGSATSWIMDHILNDTGGFYNRATCRMYLQPFTLHECEELIVKNGITMTRKQLIESYMIFGGIPFYLNLLDERLSLVQNIDELIFRTDGVLCHEYENLFYSLYKNAENHIAIIKALSAKKSGMTRVELIERTGIADGAPLTRALSELEQCGFIRKYKNAQTQKNGCIFQIIDPFVLFSQTFTEKKKIKNWSSYIKSPGYHAWAGNAFEIVCLNHISQIRDVLGISGISSAEYTWRSKTKADGAQIDLLIDRADDEINICEMKFTEDPLEIDATMDKNIRHKIEVYRTETGSKKALIPTLITANGLKRNAYADNIVRILTGEDLFRV